MEIYRRKNKPTRGKPTKKRRITDVKERKYKEGKLGKNGITEKTGRITDIKRRKCKEAEKKNKE